MERILKVIQWLKENYKKVSTILFLFFTALLYTLQLIPGSQGEAFVQSVINFLVNWKE